MARWIERVADLPGWLLAGAGALALLWAAAAAVSSVLLPRWKRCGAVAFWTLLTALLMHAGRYILQAWVVPLDVWLAGAAVGWLAVLIGGRDRLGIVVFGLLWLLALGVAAAHAADHFGLARAIEGGLLLAGWLVFVPASWALWLAPAPEPRAPEPPQPVAVPAPPQPTLVEQLDSDEAQEGADKYTRE